MTDSSRYCVECERLQAEVDRMRPVVEACDEVQEQFEADEALRVHPSKRYDLQRRMSARAYATMAYRAAKGADDE